MSDRYDAVVIGGGPSGATAALLLARAGWSVAVVEKSSFPRRKVCGEYVSATTLPLFRRLGIETEFLRMAGPPVNQVGLFSGNSILRSKMPEAADPANGWGRALGREHLDKLLLDTAANAGATVLQPCAVMHLEQTRDCCVCGIVEKSAHQEKVLSAGIVIAAHGSWDSGSLSTQPARRPARPADLFGFKAHFRGTRLPDGLMPLLAFPGGYGGMVHSDSERTSLSCCVRRDELKRCRQKWPAAHAADSVLEHVQQACRGVREALSSAQLDGAWLAAGPIRPGIRRWQDGRIFFAGNAAGEAHPVIAEGISMAVQSAWLLCNYLTPGGPDYSDAALDQVGRRYAMAWRKHFVWRMRAAALFAHWAMSPAGVSLFLPVLRLFPSILRASARLSGKTSLLFPQ